MLKSNAVAVHLHDDNDENKILDTNGINKQMGKVNIATLNGNKNELYNNFNSSNKLLKDANNNDIYLHYRPLSFVVPVTNSNANLEFLKTHRNFSQIGSQIKKHFINENLDVVWQETKLDLQKFYKPYLRLSKIRLTGLVVLTAMAGFIMTPGDFMLSKFVLLSCGVLFTSAAANTINQVFEVPFDSQMNRTKDRPIVCGRVSAQNAIYFALGSAILGSSILYFGLNPLTCALGVGNIFLYTCVYTPLKRISIANTWVGSVVGAIPPIMGWTAATGSIDMGAILLGGLLFLWQFPHFCALSWNLKSEYSRAGFQMMATVTPRLCLSTAFRYSLLITPLSVLFPQMNVTTWYFAALSLVPNAYLSLLAWRFYRDADSSSSRKLFRYTLVYLPIIFLLTFATKNNSAAAAAAPTPAAEIVAFQ